MSVWSERKRIFDRKRLICLTGVILAVAVCTLGWKLYDYYREQKLIEKAGDVTMVCFGDSIWDYARDETGIAAVVEKRLHAKVYNMAIGGTSAAHRSPEADDAEMWNSKDLVSIVNAITGGETNPELDEEAKRLGLYDLDYGQVDFFLLAYGLNDYFLAVERESEDPYDVNTYAGALRASIEKLQAAYPDARIMILSSTYCQVYSYGKVKYESHTMDYGGGNGPDYVATAQKVAAEYGLPFVNNYDKMHINIRNGLKYLSDAVHFTPKGREKYASILCDAILEEYEKYWH